MILSYDLIKSETQNLEELKTLQIKTFATGKVDVGLPILDVSLGENGDTRVISDGVVSAEGYDPIIIT